MNLGLGGLFHDLFAGFLGLAEASLLVVFAVLAWEGGGLDGGGRNWRGRGLECGKAFRLSRWGRGDRCGFWCRGGGCRLGWRGGMICNYAPDGPKNGCGLETTP